MNGCAVINKEAFVVGSQKMVDTMMATDIIDYSNKPNVRSVSVFSDDTDLMPAILKAKTYGKSSISLYLRNDQLLEKFATIKERFTLDINKFNI